MPLLCSSFFKKCILSIFIMNGINASFVENSKKMADYFSFYTDAVARIEHCLADIESSELRDGAIALMARYRKLLVDQRHDQFAARGVYYVEQQRVVKSLHAMYGRIFKVVPVGMPIRAALSDYSRVIREMIALQERMLGGFGSPYIPTLEEIYYRQYAYEGEVDAIEVHEYGIHRRKNSAGKPLLPIRFKPFGTSHHDGLHTRIKQKVEYDVTHYSPFIDWTSPFSSATYASLWRHPEGRSALLFMLLHEIGHVMQLHEMRFKRINNTLRIMSKKLQEREADAYALAKAEDDPTIRDGGILLFAMHLIAEPMHAIHRRVCVQHLTETADIIKVARHEAAQPFATTAEMDTHPSDFDRLMVCLGNRSSAVERRRLFATASRLVIDRMSHAIGACPRVAAICTPAVCAILEDTIEERVIQSLSNRSLRARIGSLFCAVRSAITIDSIVRRIYPASFFADPDTLYKDIGTISHLKDVRTIQG